LYLLKYSAGQWNTLVNFGAALLALDGQFSVGVNSLGNAVAQLRLPPLLGFEGLGLLGGTFFYAVPCIGRRCYCRQRPP
jgi:hypothetical protein